MRSCSLSRGPRPELQIARINTAAVSDAIAVMLFHYLVGTPDGVRHFTERIELTLSSPEEYLAGLNAAGLRAVHDTEGLMGRGLCVGVNA